MSKVLYPVSFVNSAEQLTLKFRLQFTSAGAPDVQVPQGSITAATRTSTGLYTITLPDAYPVFIGGFAHVMGATAAHNQYVNITPSDYATSTGVLTFRVELQDGTTAVEDVADNDWVYFELTFCRRSALAPSGSI